MDLIAEPEEVNAPDEWSHQDTSAFGPRPGPENDPRHCGVTDRCAHGYVCTCRCDACLSTREAANLERDQPTTVAMATVAARDAAAVHHVGVVVDPKKTCNKHDDCDAEDRARASAGRPRAYHCWAEDCEECFGC